MTICLFQRASDYLSPSMKNTDGLLHLHAYWAHLEAKLEKDITAARGVWENFLKTWFNNVHLHPFTIKCFSNVLFILSNYTILFNLLYAAVQCWRHGLAI